MMPSGDASQTPSSRYLVGIDLGTTNSALAWIDLQKRSRGNEPNIQAFPVPQLVSPAVVAEKALLPSFLYLPGEHDLPAGATALPWDATATRVVGEFARNQGSRVPGRLVTSAKSWLCHAGVDRTAPLLPFGAPPDVPRVSPVDASTAYLRHLVEAWNHVMAKGKPDNVLQKQIVVLTVPASFDDVARTLTVEAARKAGFEHLTLLEEPQAAFYCWLATHPPSEAEALKPGQRCLVVDVGGGTSDFSLIECVEERGSIGFVRRAVGNHLLLGGDNMDLALAKFVEGKLFKEGSSSRLDAVQYGLLTQGCRQAKEALLAPNPPASFPVSVMGRGRSVIASSLHATVTPTDVHKILFEGFFPQTARDAVPSRGARTGLHEMGLPYVSDPAVTRHLAEFLQRHAGDEGSPPVDAILFNGGVFQPASLREHLLSVLRQWYDTPKRRWEPLVLTNPSLDLAVSLGAAYYAWLRHSGGKRIGGGIARSYYLGVGGAADNAKGLTVVCVVPRRLEEGHEIHLEKPELELALGQPVTFPLYTSTVRARDKAGDVLTVKPEQLMRLPPLHTILRGGKRAGVKNVPVTLAARSTEIGTLELFCVAKEGDNRWRLEFNVREVVKDDEEEGDASAAGSISEVWPEEKVQEGIKLIRGVFDGSLDLKPQELTNALEPAVDAKREEWPTGLCRRLWETLMEVTDHRRRSPGHLNRWYNLIGYCLRPGFGDPLDKFRIEKLWKLIYSPTRQDASGGRAVPEGGSQQWIMWRRVSGGLQTSYQQALFDRVKGPLLGTSKGAIKPGNDELAEMWRMAASLERLDIKPKEMLGQALLKQVKRSPAPTYAFWSLTRLGARSLLYGPLNAVLHHQTVEAWLEAILGFQPGHQSETMAWGFCLSQLARRTGQRALDIDESHRRSALTVLNALNIPKDWVRGVEEVVEQRAEDQSQLFGDSLPIGLRLLPQE